MREGQKVSWIDPVSGRKRFGTLIEKQMVTDESQPLKDMYDEPKFKTVNKWVWLIKEEKTNSQFSFEESQLEIVKPN